LWWQCLGRPSNDSMISNYAHDVKYKVRSNPQTKELGHQLLLNYRLMSVNTVSGDRSQ
jgi:hypothetical protein